jgi:hypothetical protein
VTLTEPRLGSDPRASWAPYPARIILPRLGAVQYLDCSIG